MRLKSPPIGWWVAALLTLMAVLMISSVRNDSLTTDEKAHLPAGVSYAMQFDSRLNPEHPPLLKLMDGLVIAAVVNPSVPTNSASWQSVNGQWDFGDLFFRLNAAQRERIIFIGRLPFMLLSLAFGLLLFIWSRKHWGERAAFITLTLYSQSPTILAHSRYVTFDVGAGLAFFTVIAVFLTWLKEPTWRQSAILGLTLGLALLVKFSVLLIVPMLIVAMLIWLLLHSKLSPLSLINRLLVVLLLAALTIWVVYMIVTFNYPLERNYADAVVILSTIHSHPSFHSIPYLFHSRFTQPIGEYLLGLAMTIERSGAGNTAYFLGTVSNHGRSSYFPILFLTKEPLPIIAMAILSAVALLVRALYSAWLIRRDHQPVRTAIVDFCQRNFAELFIFSVIAVYWWFAVRSDLNIGFRHVLPTLPLLYLLIGRVLDGWLAGHHLPRVRYGVMVGLTLWLLIETLVVYPHYLSYYNELAGGWRNGYWVAVDSNYDWGQDLKRLADYTKKQGIDKIAIDYFGGADPSWYLPDHYIPWSSMHGPVHGWLAVSSYTLQTAKFGAVDGFGTVSQSYWWLSGVRPVAQVGSIFVYDLP